MSLLFISYRRDDTRDIAGRIGDRLVQKFGREDVTIDVDSIPLGMDFRVYLQQKVQECTAMLVIIGKQWLKIADDQGRRRLDDPKDWVRIEIEAALIQEKLVVPLFVQGASMPHANELPESLRNLVY